MTAVEVVGAFWVACVLGVTWLFWSAGRSPVVEVEPPPAWTAVDWDLELQWLLWDFGIYIEPPHVPVSDEELLDVGYVVGVVQ